MSEINSTDYHDFVFADGKLVGEFEQMYQKSSDVPWHQDRDFMKIDYRIAIEVARMMGPYDEIWELGCGLGYFCRELSFLIRDPDISGYSIIGADISRTAISRARELFPKYQFEYLDLCKPAYKEKWVRNLIERKIVPKQLVVTRGCFWYLFPHMEQVVKNISMVTASGNFLLISQNFPPLEKPFVGRDVIPNPKALLSFFKKYFQLTCENYLADYTKQENDNWLIALLQRNGTRVK